MKLTTSATYNALASASNNVIMWKAYVRKVTVLSQALTGTWTDATIYIPSFPEIKTKIEYQLGQGTVDSLSITGDNITWWKANVFNAASNEYIEMKITFQIVGASDVITMFAGIVDKITEGQAGVVYNEQNNTVSFTIRTNDDVGNRLPAELVTCQPLNVSGYVVLPTLIGMSVVDTNLASYPLAVGTHTIYYDYNAGTPRGKLDNGAWKNLTGTNDILGNVDNTANDTQRVKVTGTVTGGITASDKIVILTANSALPKRFYRNVTARFLLTKLYEQIGITTLTFDNIEFTTYDAAKMLFYIDTPINNDGTLGQVNCIESDGTNLFVSKSNNIYKRNMLTGVYTSLTTGMTATRLMYDQPHDHLWGFDGTNVVKISVTSGVVSNFLNVFTQTNAVVPNSMAIVDYNYTGTSYKYGLVFTDENGATNLGRLRFIDGTGGATIAVADIVTGNGLGYFTNGAIKSKFMYSMSSNKFRFRVTNDTSQHAYREYTIASGTGIFTDGGEKIPGIEDVGALGATQDYHLAETRVYYYLLVAGVVHIKSHTDASATATNIYTAASGDIVDCLYYSAAEAVVYFTAAEATTQTLYSLAANVKTTLATGAFTDAFSKVYGNGRLYMINQATASLDYGFAMSLYQWSNQVVPNVPLADFQDQSVTAMINKVFNAFNLIGTVSSLKTAQVYRRGNSSGNPVTSGNSVAVTVKDASDLTETIAGYAKFDLVTVKSQTATNTYNGTAFNVGVLSNRRTLTIDNNFIPDSMGKDLAYYLWQFFKTDRTLYTIPLALRFLLQYEPFDTASLTFATTKIQRTASGIIYGASVKSDGVMEMEVLV